MVKSVSCSGWSSRKIIKVRGPVSRKFSKSCRGVGLGATIVGKGHEIVVGMERLTVGGKGGLDNALTLDGS
jgi:hypothetical protein